MKELYSDVTNRYLLYNGAIDVDKSEGHAITSSKNQLNISMMQIRILDTFFQYMNNIDGDQDVVKVSSGFESFLLTFACESVLCL